MKWRALRVLLALHALATLAAGTVLVVAPGAIPGAVGIHVAADTYLVCYLLAAAEFGLAVLSWGARSVTDVKALRVIVVAIVLVHAASGLLETYAFMRGVSGTIWGNIAFRALAVGLFTYFGPGRST